MLGNCQHLSIDRGGHPEQNGAYLAPSYACEHIPRHDLEQYMSLRGFGREGILPTVGRATFRLPHRKP